MNAEARMGEWVSLVAADGKEIDAFRSLPARAPVGASSSCRRSSA
jgi:hypothetical protein